MGWTDERIEILEKLWKDGKSCNQIAVEIGGITRNAVIGKIHRLGLQGRELPSPPTKAPKPRANAQGVRKAREAAKRPALSVAGNGLVFEKGEPRLSPLPPTKHDAWEALPGSEPVSIEDRPIGGCQWPINGPEGRLLACCLPKADVRYCVEHAKLSRSPDQPKARTGNELMRSLRFVA